MARLSRASIGRATLGVLLLGAACRPPAPTLATPAATPLGPDQPVSSPPAQVATTPPSPAAPLALTIIRDPACPIVHSSGWTARIDAKPGPAPPRLIVSGFVGLKPATRTRLRLDPAVMESYPVQRTVILEASTPRAPTIDMLTRREVRGEWPVTPPLGSITVRCGKTVIARITDIVTAL